MKTLRRFRPYLALVLSWLILAPIMPMPEAQAQVVPLPATVEPVFRGMTTDDTDVALLVQFIPSSPSTTNNSGTVTVTVTSSDITFKQGAQGSEAASTELECPVSGALGGIIDVSDAACNTLGEIADVINASTSWRAVILDGFRTDVWDARGQVMAETRATSNNGLALTWDTSTAFDATQALTPFRKMSDYIIPGTRTLKHDPYTGSRTSVYLGSATSTYGSGTSRIRFYSVDVSQTSATKFSETVTEIYNTAGGATTAAQSFDFRDIGLHGRRNEKVVARLDNSAAMASVSFTIYGLFQLARP